MITESDIIRQIDSDLAGRHIQDGRIRDFILACMCWLGLICLMGTGIVYLIECCSPFAGIVPDFLTSLEPKGPQK